MQKQPFPVLLFDGACNLCNGSVQWLLARDKKGCFYYASLQSDTGKKLLMERGLPTDRLDTVVLVTKNAVFTHSDAPLEILRLLGGVWQLGCFFKLVPRFARDAIYRWVARNRYRWFGQSEHCLMPKPEWKARFLDA